MVPIIAFFFVSTLKTLLQKKKKKVCVHTSVNVCVSKTNLAPNLRICTFRDFAGSPPVSARGAGSVPVWEAKIPYTLQTKSYKTKAIL